MCKQRFLNLLGAVMVIFAILPLMLNPGTIALLLGGLVLLSTSKWNEKWRKRLMPQIALGLIIALVYTGLIFYFGECRQPPADLRQETVVVLGCKVNGDQPSQMLRRRLDAAVSYLNDNSDALCIVSGGQGSNEVRSEASVMKDYLLAQGIDESRIYAEDQSTDTKENLLFSKAIMEEKGLNPNIVIISDSFHQFRAWLIAQKLELTSYAVSGHTSFWLVPAYAVREVLSLVKLLPFLAG